MKKIVLILLILLLIPFTANAIMVLVRESSGEVDEIGYPGVGYYPYHIIVENPVFVDGTELLDSSNNRRVFGYAKIYDQGTGTVRNATQAEIDGFAAAVIEDQKQEEADRAKEYFQNNPEFRKIMKSLIGKIIDEINILRSEHGMAPRTMEQARTAIKDGINKDD